MRVKHTEFGKPKYVTNAKSPRQSCYGWVYIFSDDPPATAGNVMVSLTMDCSFLEEVSDTSQPGGFFHTDAYITHGEHGILVGVVDDATQQGYSASTLARALKQNNIIKTSAVVTINISDGIGNSSPEEVCYFKFTETHNSSKKRKEHYLTPVVWRDYKWEINLDDEKVDGKDQSLAITSGTQWTRVAETLDVLEPPLVVGDENMEIKNSMMTSLLM